MDSKVRGMRQQSGRLEESWSVVFCELRHVASGERLAVSNATAKSYSLYHDL